MTATVTVDLSREGKFGLTDNRTSEDLNPKELLLYAAAQCSGQTLLHILQRERLVPKRVEITVTGELSTPELRSESLFVNFHMIYNIECAGPGEQVKASRAANLTHDKYCGMVRMLRMIAPVSHEIAIVSTEPVDA